MGPAKRALTVALAQLPTLAMAWGVHGALLLFIFWTRVPAQVGLVDKVVMLVGILSLLVVEVGLLTIANTGIELATGWSRVKVWIDAVKGLSVAAIVGLLATSTLKFHATNVHLKYSDFWFARHNLRQILQEAPLFEALSILAIPGGALVLGVVTFIGLRRSRAGGARISPRRVLALTTLAAVGLGSALFVSRATRLFAAEFVPETHKLLIQRAPNFPTARPLEEGGELGPPIERYAPTPPNEPLNVVLIMIESVPWSRTSFGGGRAGVTPNLERLAEESILFERPYTTSTHSDYAQMAILSSLHPRKYDRHDYYTELRYPRTLIWDALRPAGYATSMFSCQNETWGNMLKFLNTPGLQVLRHSLHWPRARRRGRGAESKVYEETPVNEWMAWRREHGEGPYFTYLNFQSNHFPYELPPEAPRPFRPYEIDFPASFLRYPVERVPLMLNRFDNALGYADAEIGRVVDFLRERGEWERTALVVVSDHGEAFYEHEEPTHGTALYEEQVRSFLLIRLPGVAARRVEEPVSLLDVAPTLLRHLSLEAHGNFQGRDDIVDPSYSGVGRAFHFTIQGLTLEDGVLLDGWKYVVNWDRRFRRLFDLSTDPEERNNLVEVEPDRAEALDRELKAFLARQVGYYTREGWREGRYPLPLWAAASP